MIVVNTETIPGKMIVELKGLVRLDGGQVFVL